MQSHRGQAHAVQAVESIKIRVGEDSLVRVGVFKSGLLLFQS